MIAAYASWHRATWSWGLGFPGGLYDSGRSGIISKVPAKLYRYTDDGFWRGTVRSRSGSGWHLEDFPLNLRSSAKDLLEYRGQHWPLSYLIHVQYHFNKSPGIMPLKICYAWPIICQRPENILVILFIGTFWKFDTLSSELSTELPRCVRMRRWSSLGSGTWALLRIRLRSTVYLVRASPLGIEW